MILEASSYGTGAESSFYVKNGAGMTALRDVKVGMPSIDTGRMGFL